MRALNSIRNYKKSIALIFAVSILAVTACDVVCRIDGSRYRQAVTKDSIGQSQSSFAEQDDDYCKDNMNQFYKSLFNISDSGIVKAPEHTFILLTVLSNHLVSSGSYRNSPGNILTISSNLSGSHLRILISSFLI